MNRENLAEQLAIANTQLSALTAELVYEHEEKAKRAAELIVANIELAFQNEEKEKRAAELLLANTELLFQNNEKEDRANELIIANRELVFQNQEKQDRADELAIANKELTYQNQEKQDRADELVIANKELLYQNQEKQDRADELVTANKELIYQSEEREKRIEGDAKKDEFFNMVSHELKTPLTNIKAINQILTRSVNKEDRIYPFIIKSNQSVLRLERLIEDLLDVTKINSGEIDLNISEFFFADILSQSIETVQQLSPQHKIILENTVDIFYTGDQFRLERVVINLLNNAIKYSPNASEVIVKAFVENSKITVCVLDSGIGIDQEDIDKLFKRFFRVSKIANQFNGVGLGLYIAAEIVKKHNGTFSIDSEPGVGSNFCFHLPIG
ncbi:HAMP domain-containing sensor histidine kinase [Mucilaginibacter sp. dw_454]|uniref:sensor histidine kinase n=1 Tax=Mucilaginibacter sp. dw_454 TaxID=2720079 RepID=UPI001BD2EBA0|nr:HAMP domain-containing sensor histidine kinase [Mucilaginibacter sp. dw_454]